MSGVSKHQREQLKTLRDGAGEAYSEASIYVVLLDLCEESGAGEVQAVLNSVTKDLEDDK